MNKDEFQKEIDRNIFNITEIAYMAIDVTDSQEIQDAGQNYLQELINAEFELEKVLTQENIKILESD